MINLLKGCHISIRRNHRGELIGRLQIDVIVIHLDISSYITYVIDLRIGAGESRIDIGAGECSRA